MTMNLKNLEVRFRPHPHFQPAFQIEATFGLEVSPGFFSNPGVENVATLNLTGTILNFKVLVIVNLETKLTWKHDY